MRAMKSNLSSAQVKDVLAKEVTKFYAKTLGHGPRETRVYIVEDMVLIRLKGSLLPLEEKLLEGNKGIGIVKNLRFALHEIITKRLSTMVEEITTHKVVSSHSDISTKTGEIFEVFILDTNYESDLERPIHR